MKPIIIVVIIVVVGLLVCNSDISSTETMFKSDSIKGKRSGRKENFTRRINNLQPLPVTQKDKDIWQRKPDYYRTRPVDHSKIGSNKQIPTMTHTNMVPFFKGQGYKTYTDSDEQHPQLDRITGDRPAKEVIAPFSDMGRDHYFDKNEIGLGKARDQEYDLESKNFSSYNAKNFQFIGGDPVRVGRGIIDPEGDTKGDGVTPSGGFHSMYRADELNRDELTGEDRPAFDKAVLVPGLKGNGKLDLGEMTKTFNAKSFSLDAEQNNSCSTVGKQTERGADLIYKQQKTNDAKYPYEGPALITKYGQTIDNISNQLEPKEVRVDPSVDACVNYYHVTSNPGAYTDSVHKAPNKDKNIEKYADYNYINDSVQSHVYVEYDPYNYNSVHTGNDYVCLTRRGNINSTDHSVYYDPDQTDALPKKVNDYTRSDRVGNIEGSSTKVGTNIHADKTFNKDTIRYSYSENGRDPTATARAKDIALRSAEMTKIHRDTYDINSRELHMNNGGTEQQGVQSEATRMGANANAYTVNTRVNMGSKSSLGDGAYNLMKVDIHKNKRNINSTYSGIAGGAACGKGTVASEAKNVIRKHNSEYEGRASNGQANVFRDTVIGKNDNNKRELVYSAADQSTFNKKGVASVSKIDDRLKSIFDTKGKQKLCGRENVMVEAPTF